MDNKTFVQQRIRLLSLVLLIPLLAGCAARQAQDSLSGSTAQKLVSYSIDDLAGALPETHFSAWARKQMILQTHMIGNEEVRQYADKRLALELRRRFDIEIVEDRQSADGVINVFYTSLGTDRDTKGFFLPLGYLPGMEADNRINLLTLEQFQGVAELYYFIGETGIEQRGKVLNARTRSDAIGLPIITIPVSNIKRD